MTIRSMVYITLTLFVNVRSIKFLCFLFRLEVCGFISGILIGRFHKKLSSSCLNELILWPSVLKNYSVSVLGILMKWVNLYIVSVWLGVWIAWVPWSEQGSVISACIILVLVKKLGLPTGRTLTVTGRGF